MTIPCELRVFTFKRGMLSGFGHNLMFAYEGVLNASPSRGPDAWVLTVDPRRLGLVGAIVGQPPTPDAPAQPPQLGSPRTVPLGPQQSSQVVSEMLRVLKIDRFGEIVVQGSHRPDLDESRRSLDVELTLCGQTRQISLSVDGPTSTASGVAEIVPSHFGIPPYRAMLGALQLQDRVRVEAFVGEPGQSTG